MRDSPAILFSEEREREALGSTEPTTGQNSGQVLFPVEEMLRDTHILIPDLLCRFK